MSDSFRYEGPGWYQNRCDQEVYLAGKLPAQDRWGCVLVGCEREDSEWIPRVYQDDGRRTYGCSGSGDLVGGRIRE